ncbi:hypothetical protein F2Q68_00014395 [Brassica cretica]|uniref:DUF1985 domain-containing protein n=1 Tax=Brassica cretica TaxID=69181 RepID=A0A8S9HN28_BRACR|nr:hypothetical protein F2Q68_00014395 [Brassica cretica]
MELELPKRLYAKGLEPQVMKINNCCRMELIRDLKKAMSAEYNDVKIDHVFKHIMAIADNKLGFSGKSSGFQGNWWTSLRFSLQEYHAVTGLKVSRESSSDVVTCKNDGGFWSSLLRTGDKITLKSIRKVHLKEVHKWTRIDRMRLIYLCVIMGVVMGRDEKVNIPDIFVGPRCGNWKGVANVSYEDIIELEDSLTKKGDLFSVISETGNGDMFLHVDYTRKGEMEDERVDLLLDRIRQKV